MALRILSSPSEPGDLERQLAGAIESAIPGAQVQVASGSPGHFALRVVSQAFADKSRVAQQQLVYGAIAHLMQGDAAPVHAIDRLETLLP